MTKVGYYINHKGWVPLGGPKMGTTSTTKVGCDFDDQNWVQLGQPVIES